MHNKNFRQRTLGLSGALVLANMAAWVWAYLAYRDQPVLLGTAFLAYSFGLRHALDADHIAAIDNVTRKLVQNGDRPISVGFYFALGHSTVVIIAVLIVYWTAAIAGERFKQWREVGEIISTCVSACFLFAIALINLLAMRDTYRALKKQRQEAGSSIEAGIPSNGGGIVSKLLRPLMNGLSKPSQMYPVGFLFGLGFEDGNRNCFASGFSFIKRQRAILNERDGAPGPFHRRNDVGRYRRRNDHGRRLQLGFHQSDSETLL